MLPIFIRLENTFEKAMLYNGSPYNVFESFNGVHLVSEYPYPYIQRTYASEGIELETIICRVFSMCGTLLATLPDGDFTVVNEFQDPNTGLPQIDWSLKTDSDFGEQLIYLGLFNGTDYTVYSSPFTLTADNSNYTSYWAYRSSGQMLSIGLCLWFRQKMSAMEISNYSPVSSGVQYTATSRLTPYERWYTEIIENEILEEFKYIFRVKDVYSARVDTLEIPVKTGLHEPIESVDLEGQENFIQQQIMFSRNYSVTYNPNAEVIVPHTPPVDAPEIVLTRVERVNENQVRYIFTYDNFTPDYLTFEFSSNGVDWSPSTNQPLSPRVVTVLDNIDIGYQYRITHPLATSNIVTIPVPKIVLDPFIEKTGSGQFTLMFTVSNFTPDESIVVEYSEDNETFLSGFTSSTTTSPISTTIPALIAEPYFRLRYNDLGLTSNVEQWTM